MKANQYEICHISFIFDLVSSFSISEMIQSSQVTNAYAWPVKMVECLRKSTYLISHEKHLRAKFDSIHMSPFMEVRLVFKSL